MKQLHFLILVFLLAACGTSMPESKTAKVQSIRIDTTTNASIAIQDTAIDQSSETETVTYFVVVADTSSNYYALHKKMFELNRQLSIPIDTMGRFYNETKKLITLPDEDEDDIYAGDYFPRRFPSNNLSLEYLDFYQEKAGEKTIALVTGIYETEKNADNAMIVLQKIEKNVFKIKANIYVGCLH